MKKINKVLEILLAAVIIIIPQTFSIFAEDDETQDYNDNVIIKQKNDFIDIENADDISVIAKYPNIKNIYLDNDTITSFSIFENDNIQYINFKDCYFDISDKSKLPDNIEGLHVADSNIDVNKITSKNLTELTIEGVDMVDLSFLKYANNIERLDIYGLTLESCKGLENLTKVKYVSIQNVGIESADELASLKNLDTLYLCKTYVRDLSVLENSNIGQLSLDECTEIKDFEFIKKMPKLKYLSICNCVMNLTDDVMNYLYKSNNIEYYYNKDYSKEQQQIKQIDDKIINKNMSSRDKVKTIVQYVIDHMKYDTSCIGDYEKTAEYNRDYLKYALQGTGCCANYAGFTQALLEEAGIKAYLNEGNHASHLWNIAYIEGYYYFIDPTYIDDSIPKRSLEASSYFLAPFDSFCTSHDIETEPSSMLKLDKYGIADETLATFHLGSAKDDAVSQSSSKGKNVKKSSVKSNGNSDTNGTELSDDTLAASNTVVETEEDNTTGEVYSTAEQLSLGNNSTTSEKQKVKTPYIIVLIIIATIGLAVIAFEVKKIYCMKEIPAESIQDKTADKQ